MRQVCGYLWVLPYPPPKKTDYQDITEILLKVALNTITLTCFVFKLKRKKQVLALVLIEDLGFLPLMRNSASFHSFRYAPLVKRRNFSHSWKKFQIFNRDSRKNLLFYLCELLLTNKIVTFMSCGFKGSTCIFTIIKISDF